MNMSDPKYNRFALVKEMIETPDIVKNLNIKKIGAYEIKNNKVLLTGEGSSRIFPAKNTLCNSLRMDFSQRVVTENASQAAEYRLDDYSVFIASNSGRTAEAVRLISRLRAAGHSDITAIAARCGTPVVDAADSSYILTCGAEDAVAATKSVIEHALFYDILFRRANGAPLPDLNLLSASLETVLSMDIAEDIILTLAASPMIYFAGRNNGVAEELRLKTNEITRKKSDYLEGTYAVHGIEEVMSPGETLIIIEPFEAELGKIKSVIEQGAGLTVITISCRETGFRNILIPHAEDCGPYIQLAAGWNLLVETGIAAGIDLDKPVRTRKVGNEFTG